jgi:hypothetical protein
MCPHIKFKGTGLADLHVTWMKPIKLAKIKGPSLDIDVDDVPTTSGVYMFFRRQSTNSTEVVYVGKAINLKQRVGWHGNNHALIVAMLAKPGSYYVMPGEFKARGTQNPAECIATIERVLIRKCIEDGHPLINVKGSRIVTRHVISTLPARAKFLSESIGFEPQARKAPPTKTAAAKKAAAKKRASA